MVSGPLSPNPFPPPADGWLDGHAPIGEAEGRPDAEPPVSRLALGVGAVFWLVIGWIVWGVVGG